jgi:hypothetical protein
MLKVFMIANFLQDLHAALPAQVYIHK